jgi:hypothetical protein
VGGNLLVPNVDDANTLVDATVVNIDDMTATQGKDGVDTLVFEGLRHQMSTRYDIRFAALLGERVFGSSGSCRDILGCGGHDLNPPLTVFVSGVPCYAIGQTPD